RSAPAEVREAHRDARMGVEPSPERRQVLSPVDVAVVEMVHATGRPADHLVEIREMMRRDADDGHDLPEDEEAEHDTLRLASQGQMDRLRCEEDQERIGRQDAAEAEVRALEAARADDQDDRSEDEHPACPGALSPE